MLRTGSYSASSPLFFPPAETPFCGSDRKHSPLASFRGFLKPFRLLTEIPKCIRIDEIYASKLLLERKQQLGGRGEDVVIFNRGRRLLKELSTLGIEGPCNYFVEVFNEIQLISAIRCCTSHMFLVIGKGSNCLFDDSGFDGCIILNCLRPYRVGSGYPVNKVGVQGTNGGFGGLEFAGEVPGTVGGAAFMNAGADGQETADNVESIEIITTDGIHRVLQRKELTFGYRTSSFLGYERVSSNCCSHISF